MRMPINFSLNTKSTRSSMLSTTLRLFLLAPMLVSFVAGVGPLTTGLGTSCPVDDVFMPEKDVVSKYNELAATWRACMHAYKKLISDREDVEARLLIDSGSSSRAAEAEKLSKAYANTRAQRFARMVSETNSNHNQGDFEILEPQTRAAVAHEFGKADGNTRVQKLASTVPATDPSLSDNDFKLVHNALRFAELWVERNMALQWLDLAKAEEATKDAEKALIITFGLQMDYLEKGMLPPNPYRMREYSQIMRKWLRVTGRHHMFIPTSENLKAKLGEIAVKRAEIEQKLAKKNVGASELNQLPSVQHNGNGVAELKKIRRFEAFEALLLDPETYKLEKVAQMKLDKGDVIGCVRALRKRQMKLYPQKKEESEVVNKS